MNAVKSLYEKVAQLATVTIPSETGLTIELVEEGYYNVYLSPYAFSIRKQEDCGTQADHDDRRHIEGTQYFFADFSVVYGGGYESITAKQAIEKIQELTDSLSDLSPTLR